MGSLLTLLRPKGEFSPADIPGLALWLDASDDSTLTATTTGATVKAGGLILPGAAGNYASTPYAAALDITGDLDIRVLSAVESPGGLTLMLKRHQVGTGAYVFSVQANRLKLWWFAGGSIVSATATTTIGTDLRWYRVTLDVDNGAGGYDVKFYEAEPSSGDPVWEQVGATITGAGTTSIDTSIAPLAIGNDNGAFTGIYIAQTCVRAQVYDGIDGTLVFDADFTTLADGVTSFTESSSNAATVTINSTTSGLFQGPVSQWDDKSGNARHVTQGTAANQPTTGLVTINGRNTIDFDGTADYMEDTFGVTLTQPTTVFVVWKAGTTTGTRVAFDNDATSSVSVGYASSAFSANAGTALAGGTADTATNVVAFVANGASSSVRVNGVATATGAAGANSLTGVSVGADIAGANFFDGTIPEVIVYDGALDAGQVASVESHLANKWGVTLA